MDGRAFSDRIRPQVQTKFGGLNHSPAAADGELYDMRNLTGDLYPLLSTRQKRRKVETLTEPGGVFAWNKLAWVDGTKFIYDGGEVDTVTPGKKVFAAIGAYIVIFPDKKYYDTTTGVFGSLEAVCTGRMSFRNGTFTGVPADANTIYLEGASWGADFRPGDAVNISGCVVHPENNASFIIREVDGDYLRFYDNTFVLDRLWTYTAGEDGLDAGTYHFTPSDTALQFTAPAMSEGDTLSWDGTAMTATVGGVTSTVTVTEGSGGDELFFGSVWVDYTETGTVTVSRDVPELDFVCENENRLWGSDGQRIFASKLGDPFNFNVFDGLDTDSWVWPVDEAGIIGGITACISFLGYPVFFQENKIFKVYGSRPSNYQVMGGAALGVMAGASASLAIAGETLFYLSSAGFMAYGGGLPRPIGQAFGLERQGTAVGGSDGLKYYVSFQDGGEYWHFGVYDPQKGTWHLEDETEAVGFTRYGGNTYCLAADGRLLVIGTVLGTPGTEEADFDWFAEFSDFTDSDPYKKGVEKLLIRMELEAGASCVVHLKFDSDGDWIQAGETMAEDTKRSYILPVVPRRADHYRVRLFGHGGCRVYSIDREQYSGSGLKSLPGRN